MTGLTIGNHGLECDHAPAGGMYTWDLFSSRRRHTRLQGDWSSDVCSSDLHREDSGLPGNLEDRNRALQYPLQQGGEGIQHSAERLLAQRRLFCLRPIRERRIEGPDRVHLRRQRRHLRQLLRARRRRRGWERQADRQRQRLDLSLGRQAGRKNRLLPGRQYVHGARHDRIPAGVFRRQGPLDGDGEGARTQTGRPQMIAKRGVRFRTYSLLGLFVFLRPLGNLSLAWGTKHFPQVLSLNPVAYLRAMVDPFVALGIAMLILALLTRMALLSLADLSFVLPVTAIGYVLAALFGRVFLHEAVSAQQWMGTVLIFMGTGLVGTTSQNTTPPEEESE